MRYQQHDDTKACTKTVKLKGTPETYSLAGNSHPMFHFVRENINPFPFPLEV